MKVDFSKDFSKALDKLSGKLHHSIVEAINDVIDVECVEDIKNCLNTSFPEERPTTKRIWIA